MRYNQKEQWQFASESVSEGHPDKVCDRISDGVVDAFFERDNQARCAVETLVTTNKIVLAGETKSTHPLSEAEIEAVVRAAVRDIGYEQEGFHWETADVEVLLHEQSADIAQGVDAAGNKDEGAGDQGIMFGYACRETEALMPAPIFYAHKILKNLAQARKQNDIEGLEPDAKSQISLIYEGGKPQKTSSLVLSTQHREGLSPRDVREMVRPIIMATLPEGWMCSEENFHVNPTGNFVIGGPVGDAGLTGRKIIVDTYGGAAPHGGGAFSGKDPTKVDRSAAYAARYLAKNVVAAGVAERCTVQLSYAIGVAYPLSIYFDFHDTGKCPEAILEKKISSIMDLSPKGIRTHLELNRSIYARTAAYGHFGREPESDGGFSWEKTDLKEKIAALV
jgi:S-adenosylmethionine synthetase